MKNKIIIKNLTIVIVSYKSSEKVLNILKKTKNFCNFIIVENSQDKFLKRKINKLYNRNIKVILSKNIGYGNAVNLAFRYVKTKYFLAFGPDIDGIGLLDLFEFISCAKKIKKFGALGPRFVNNKTNKNLIQTNKQNKINKINCLSGAVLFFDKKIFGKLKGFDKNIFLFFEENDYSLRANKNDFYSYQINSIKVHHQHGKSVTTKNNNDKKLIKLLTTWHFTWSKFYFFKKHYTYLLALIYLLPLMIRCFFKRFYYSRDINSFDYKKYKLRGDAIITSIKNEKSYLREQDIKKMFFS